MDERTIADLRNCLANLGGPLSTLVEGEVYIVYGETLSSEVARADGPLMAHALETLLNAAPSLLAENERLRAFLREVAADGCRWGQYRPCGDGARCLSCSARALLEEGRDE